MPKNSAHTEALREERRATILGAAAQVFARRGFIAAKIGDIAQAAGLSHGLVYHYFENKEALLCELLEARIVDGEAELAGVSGSGSPFERLCRTLERLLDEHEPELSLVFIHALVNDALPERARALLQAHAQRVFEGLTALVMECRHDGSLPPDSKSPAEVTTALLSAVRGFALHQNVDLGIPVTRPTVDLVLRLAMPPRAV